jgi:hypothetical protein
MLGKKPQATQIKATQTAAKTGKLGGKLLGAAGTAFTAYDEFSKGTKYQGTGTEALNVATTVGAGLAVPAALSAAGTLASGAGLAAAGTATGAALAAAAPLAVAAGGLAAGAAAGRYLQTDLDDYESTQRSLRIQRDLLQNASSETEKEKIRSKIDDLEKQSEEDKPGIASRAYDATYGNVARGVVSGINSASELLFGKETPESMRQKSLEAREKQLGPGAKTVQQLDYEAEIEAKKKMAARSKEQVAADIEREKKKEEIEARNSELDTLRQAAEQGYELDDETAKRFGYSTGRQLSDFLSTKKETPESKARDAEEERKRKANLA